MGTKSVAEKLLVKPGTTIWSSNAAQLEMIGPLPAGVRRVDTPEEATTALVFAADAASVRGILQTYGDRLKHPGALWIVYPKGNRSDINRDSLWPILAEHRLRPITQVAVNDVWSALRFRALKEGEPPFTGGQ